MWCDAQEWFATITNVHIQLAIVNVLFGIRYERVNDNKMCILNFTHNSL